MWIDYVDDEATIEKASMNRFEDEEKIVTKTGRAYWAVKLNVQ